MSAWLATHSSSSSVLNRLKRNSLLVCFEPPSSFASKFSCRASFGLAGAICCYNTNRVMHVSEHESEHGLAVPHRRRCRRCRRALRSAREAGLERLLRTCVHVSAQLDHSISHQVVGTLTLALEVLSARVEPLIVCFSSSSVERSVQATSKMNCCHNTKI